MRKSYFVSAILLSALLFCGVAFAQAISDLSAKSDTLGKKGRTTLTVTVTGSELVNWDLDCSAMELEGWRSPQMVRVTKRDPSTGAITAIAGERFQPGVDVRVTVRRPENAKKGESGSCKLTAQAGESGTPEVNTVTFTFK